MAHALLLTRAALYVSGLVVFLGPSAFTQEFVAKPTLLIGPVLLGAFVGFSRWRDERRGPLLPTSEIAGRIGIWLPALLLVPVTIVAVWGPRTPENFARYIFGLTPIFLAGIPALVRRNEGAKLSA